MREQRASKGGDGETERVVIDVAKVRWKRALKHGGGGKDSPLTGCSRGREREVLEGVKGWW